jgi:hypothetical protein
MIPLDARHPQAREIPLHGGRDRFHYCQVLIVLDDLRGDRDLLVLFMSQPEPSTDLGEDVLHPFPVPQLVEDDDLVFPELIHIVVSHSHFSFRDLAHLVSPETEKAQPI